MNIELVRSKDPGFDRGERIILIDGVRWGRTHMQWRGCHGTETTFSQEHGKKIGTVSKGGYFHPIRVMSATARRSRRWIEGKGYVLPSDFQTTEQRTVSRIAELIYDGQLRHPEIVQAETAQRHADYRAKRQQVQAEAEEAFKAKAMEAVRANDPDSEIVQRVIEAMRWAQDR